MRIRLLFTTIGLLAVSSASAPEHEVHATFRIAGQVSGTYHEARSAGAQGETITQIETDLVFNRLGTKLEMKSRAVYHEDQEGRLLKVSGTISSSEQSTQIEATIASGTLAIQTSTGGKTYERNASFTGTLLGPEAARRLLLARLRTAGNTISYQTFVPDVGTVATVTSTLLAPDEGTPRPVRKIEQSLSAMPGKSTLWVDDEGWLVRQVVASPLGEMEIARTGAGATTTVPIEGAVLPEETFTRSVVRSNIRLPEERLIERVQLKITHQRPELGWPDFSAANQTVLEKSRDHVILEVRRPRAGATGLRPAAITDSLRPYLAPNALLQSDDPVIGGIVKKVVQGTDAWQAARALQRWTNENMRFDAGIAIVPASEVARNLRGTCFGYSMLLGALARAAGIPSRVRMGFVYAGGIWGGHAWVDVMAGDEWIPLDGALYSPGPADAARFSFFTSALEEGTIADVGSLARLYGNVDITILEYTVAGKTIHVPADAKPYTVNGDRYQNPWAGISFSKPPSFRFAGVDLTWPQTAFVSMEGPEHERVEVRNVSTSLPTGTLDEEKVLRDAGVGGAVKRRQIGGKFVTVASDGGKAAVVLGACASVWVIEASGPRAEALAMKVASTVRLER